MNNDDFSGALLAKSTQINALDITGDVIVKITYATYDPNKEQPMDIYIEGYSLPWRPSKGMRRIMADAWKTTKCSELVGRVLTIYCNKDVRFGSDKAGGIQIKAMTGIPKEGINTILRVGRKPTPYHVAYMEPPTAPMYPQDQFEANLPDMKAALSGDWTLEMVIAECAKVGQLTDAQIEQLKAP
jgi:hypothetical protein